MFGYFCIIDRHTHDLLNVTAISRASLVDQYPVPQVDINTLTVGFNQENYFELNQALLASCLEQDKTLLRAPKVTKNMKNAPHCVLDAIYKRPNQVRCHMLETMTKGNGTIWKELMSAKSFRYLSDTSITYPTVTITNLSATCEI